MPRRGTDLGIRDNFLEDVKPQMGPESVSGEEEWSKLPLQEEAWARNAQDGRGRWMGRGGKMVRGSRSSLATHLTKTNKTKTTTTRKQVYEA